MSIALWALLGCVAVAVSQLCPSPPPSSCPFDLSFNPGPLSLTSDPVTHGRLLHFQPGDYNLRFSFAPKLPGNYTFTFEVKDLCTTKTLNATVSARCPPSPILRPTRSASQVLRRGSVVLTTGNSSLAPFVDGVLVYTWTMVSSPQGAQAAFPNGIDLAAFVSHPTPTSMSTLSLTNLFAPGQYVIGLRGFDGCSATTVYTCVQVVCSCAPSANCRATPTVWSNLDGLNNQVKTSGFELNAGLSFDFDLLYDTAERLTYTWSFLKWVPAGYAPFMGASSPIPVNPRTEWKDAGYEGGTELLPTTENPGFTTQQTTNTNAGGVVTKTWQFLQVPRLPSFTWSNSTVFRAIGATLHDPVTTKTWLPEYPVNPVPWFGQGGLPAEEPETTTGAVVLSATESRLVQSVGYNVTNIRTTPYVGPSTLFCEISITQSPLPLGGPASHNHVAVLRLAGASTYRQCRGLWYFRVTVSDNCQSDSDEIALTVRCNRPPVAIAGCNDTYVWRKVSSTAPGLWDQVTLDGRASSDEDNSVLTYTWSFLSYPPTHACVHRPCQQSYCGEDSYLAIAFPPQPQTAAGPGSFSQAYGNPRVAGCAPTVYPVLYKPSDTSTISPSSPATCRRWARPPIAINPLSAGDVDCTYLPLPPTQYHVGNSAYFWPTAAGLYEVQLSVYDGCSTVNTRVTVDTVCPLMTVQILGSISTATRTTSKVVISYVVTLQAVTETLNTLTYAWSVSNSTGTGDFSAPTQASSTFTPTSAPGSFWVQLSVSDGCQTVTAIAPPFSYVCSASPSAVTVVTYEGSVGGPVLPPGQSISLPSSGQFYPIIVLEASATDPENDAMTYQWTMSTELNNYEAMSVSGGPTTNRLQFRGVWKGGGAAEGGKPSRFQVSVHVVAFDGCSAGPPQFLTFTYICTTGLTPRLNTTTPSVAFVFQGPTGAFPSVVVTSNNTRPYPLTTSWLWTATVSVGSGSPTPVQLSGLLFAASGNVEPLTLIPLVVGVYTVTLTLTDSCSSNLASVAITARCESEPTAGVEQKSINATWDSQATVFAGSFPLVTLQGGGSSLASPTGGQVNTMPLTFAWSAALDTPEPNAADSVVLTNANSQDATFTPTVPGVYVFQLIVSNGPCRSSNTNNIVTVNATCLVISAKIASLAADYRWDGVRFPTIRLNGFSSTYTTLTGAAANLYSLRYTWAFASLPPSSIFKTGSVSAAPVRVTFPRAPPYPAYTATVDLGLPTQAEIYNETIQFIVNSTTTSTLYATTLFNHHYNRPVTCFKPDVPGTYVIKLAISDNCASSETQVSAVIRCNFLNPPSITLPVGFKQLFVEMDGRNYKRVALDARSTAPTSATDRLTYQWVLVERPPESQLSSAAISNPNGNYATFVPDAAGRYILQVIVGDGCNPTRASNVTVNVECTDVMAPLSSAVFVNGAALPFQATASTPLPSIDYAPAAGGFAGKSFVVEGSVADGCEILKRSWRLESRVCAAPYIPQAVAPTPAPTPLPLCAGLNRTCQWEIVEFPCQANFVRPPECNSGLDRAVCALNTSQSTCLATFTPRSPGVYRLKLTVESTCARDEAYTNVTAKCGARSFADAGHTMTSLYTCKTGGYDWDELSFTGNLSRVLPNSIPAFEPCWVIATPAPTASPELPLGQCCPAASKCATCPTCPKCPDCPPGTIAVSAGHTAREDSPSHHFTSSRPGHNDLASSPSTHRRLLRHNTPGLATPPFRSARERVAWLDDGDAGDAVGDSGGGEVLLSSTALAVLVPLAGVTALLVLGNVLQVVYWRVRVASVRRRRGIASLDKAIAL